MAASSAFDTVVSFAEENDMEALGAIAQGDVGGAVAGVLAVAQGMLVSGIPLGVLVFGALFAIIAHVLLAMVYERVAPRALLSARSLLQGDAKRMFVQGLAVFAAAPVVAGLLMIPLVTAPIAVLMVAVMAMVWLFGMPFVGYVAFQALLPSRAPRSAGMLGVVVVTLACYVLAAVGPVLFAVVPTLCAVCFAGLLLRWIRANQGEGEGKRP